MKKLTGPAERTSAARMQNGKRRATASDPVVTQAMVDDLLDSMDERMDRIERRIDAVLEHQAQKRM